jgi:hypothetical protein
MGSEMECEYGRWGDKCQHNCNLSCGGFGICPWTCDSGNGNCFSCGYGKWGSNCQKDCPDQCNPIDDCSHGTCNISTGECFSCDGGYWGSNCQNDCWNCTLCNQLTGICIDTSYHYHFDLLLLLPIIFWSIMILLIIWKLVAGCCGWNPSPLWMIRSRLDY